MRPEDIVGHKTFSTGDPLSPFRHEPLTRAEAEAILEAARKEESARAERMPDEQSAISAMFQAWLRLKELGWREAMYCPKDGSTFHAIEAGSTGIHECSYDGKWPDGHYLIYADGDIWPSHPILFKASLRSKDGAG